MIVFGGFAVLRCGLDIFGAVTLFYRAVSQICVIILDFIKVVEVEVKG